MKPVDQPTRETAAFVVSHPVPDATVLEIGCGEGDVAEVLPDRGLGTSGDIVLIGRRIVASA